VPGLNLSDFLDWRARDQGRAPNTLAAYRSDLTSYEEWLGRNPSGDARAYVDALVAAGRKPASVRRAVMAIRAFHRFLGVEEPVAGPAVPPASTAALDPHELDRLLRSVDGRDRALVAVLADGLRVSEAVGLDVDAVGPECRTVEIRGHGPRDRTASLGPRAANALRGWLAERGAAPGAVFTNARGGRLSRQGAWAIVRDRGRQAGLGDRATPDLLRRVG
jgi:integrase/recombinase XerD